MDKVGKNESEIADPLRAKKKMASQSISESEGEESDDQNFRQRRTVNGE